MGQPGLRVDRGCRRLRRDCAGWLPEEGSVTAWPSGSRPFWRRVWPCRARPGAQKSIYSHAFFPWGAPVELEPGDTVAVLLRADLVGEDYVWAWNSRVLQQGREGEVKAQFTQSTLRGTPLSPARLRKRADGYRPRLGEPGEIDRFILSLMDGQTSQGDIARRASQRFPARFVSWHAALARVGDLSLRYSQLAPFAPRARRWWTTRGRPDPAARTTAWPGRRSRSPGSAKSSRSGTASGPPGCESVRRRRIVRMPMQSPSSRVEASERCSRR